MPKKGPLTSISPAFLRREVSKKEKSQKNFSTNPEESNHVDNFINIIPLVVITFFPIINNLITGYPPVAVDNKNDCSVRFFLLD